MRRFVRVAPVALLLVENGQVAAEFPVSGKLSLPRPGVYHVMNKKHPGRSGNLSLPYFTGFTWGPSSDIGFHGIPLRPDGSPIQSDEELGQPLSAGCVRVSQFWAQVIFDWYPIGTRVEVWP
jgi:lipoprotein-anchoring transpeptidase ErfK/SrfK